MFAKAALTSTGIHYSKPKMNSKVKIKVVVLTFVIELMASHNVAGIP